MKFTIEVDDFWIEEEELSEALETHVTRDVVHQITKNIESKIDQQITEKVTAFIDNRLAILIDKKLSDLIDVGVITRNREEISIIKHIENRFKDSSGWGTPDAKIDAVAKKFGEEMKLQYNTVFASRIVENMKKQGFLKDDVTRILLEEAS